MYPERVGEVGAEMLPPDWNDALATEDPPLLSKVAVYVGNAGLLALDIAAEELPTLLVAITLKV